MRMFDSNSEQMISASNVVRLNLVAFEGIVKGLPVDWSASKEEKAARLEDFLGLLSGAFTHTGSILKIIWMDSIGREMSVDNIEEVLQEVENFLDKVGFSYDKFREWFEELKEASGPIPLFSDMEGFVTNFFDAIQKEKGEPEGHPFSGWPVGNN